MLVPRFVKRVLSRFFEGRVAFGDKRLRSEGFGVSSHAIIARLYAAFNARDVDAALAFMSDDVSWPKASEGGRVNGKQAIREYWTRQWAEFDPHVIFLDVSDCGDGVTAVRVHQLVKDRAGNVLSDSESHHVYVFANGLIERMDIRDDGASEGPSAAFSSRR